VAKTNVLALRDDAGRGVVTGGHLWSLVVSLRYVTSLVPLTGTVQSADRRRQL